MKKLIMVLLIAAAACIPTFAQNPDDWREISTEHFVFIYQEKDSDAAARLAGFCEEVYGEVTAFFDSRPENVRCVIRGDLDYANGFFTPLPVHLELYVRSPVGPWLGARSGLWLRMLLTHEFAHYVDLVSDRGLFNFLSIFMGESMKGAPAAFWPFWLIEGIAVNLETDFSKGGRGRNPFFEMEARALLYENIRFNLGQLEYNSSFPPFGRNYLFGYYLVKYLRAHYGPDVYTRVRNNFLAFPFAGPWAALKEVTGKHQDAILNEMYDELQAGWKQDFSLPRGRLVSGDVVGDYFLPAVTDHGLVGYRELQSKAGAFVRVNSESGNEEILFEASLYDTASFSANKEGTTIAFASLVRNGLDANSRVFSDLYIAEIDFKGTGESARVTGNRVRRLTTDARLWQPAISPDGKRLFAVQSAGSFSRLVEVDLASGSAKPAFAMDNADVFHPVLSPDGRKLAFEINIRGMQDIWIMDVESIPPDGFQLQPEAAAIPAGLRIVTGPDEYGEHYPRFVDDATLLFASDLEGTLAAYRVSLETGNMVRVLRDPVGVQSAVNYQDGLLYSSLSSTGACLRVADNAMLQAIPVPSGNIVRYKPVENVSRISGSRPFFDLPAFEYWRPDGGYYFGPANALSVWFGVQLNAESLLGTNFWQLSIGLYPRELQPVFSFSYGWDMGAVTMYLGADHEFTYVSGSPGFYDERIFEYLSLGVPLLEHAEHNTLDYIEVYSGIQHSFIMQDDQVFRFFNDLSLAGMACGNRLDLWGGIWYEHDRIGGWVEMYPVWERKIGIGYSVPLPVFTGTTEGLLLFSNSEFSFPGFFDLDAFKLGFEAVWVTDSFIGPAYIRPRGMFALADLTGNGRALAAIDYCFTLAALDWAPGAGLHLSGIGMGLHVEMLAQWDLDPAAFYPDREIFVGAEMTFYAGIGALSFPLGIGVAARLSLEDAASFDIAQDLRPYFFLSFDSFLNAGAPGKKQAGQIRRPYRQILRLEQ